MKMSLIVEGLRSDAVAVGELGDDTVAEVAERIAAVLGRAVPGRVLDLLSDGAAELTAELPEGRVEVRVTGDDVDLAFVDDAPAPGGAGGGDDAGRGDDAALTARITLRLGEGLKARVEERAAQEGVSVNTFVVRTLERGTAAPRRGTWSGRGPGNRLRGYGVT